MPALIPRPCARAAATSVPLWRAPVVVAALLFSSCRAVLGCLTSTATATAVTTKIRWPQKQTLILKIARIFLLGVLSAPPAAAAVNQPTPPAAARRTLDAPPATAVAAGAGAGAVAPAAVAAVAPEGGGGGVALRDGADGGGDGGGFVNSAEALLPPSSSSGVAGGDAAGLGVSCSGSSISGTETETRSLAPGESPSLLEAVARSPSEGEDQGGVGGGGGGGGGAGGTSGGCCGGDASATCSGPESRERGGLWACLPVDVTAAVLGAVELPELQVRSRKKTGGGSGSVGVAVLVGSCGVGAHVPRGWKPFQSLIRRTICSRRCNAANAGMRQCGVSFSAGTSVFFVFLSHRV